MFHPLKPIRTRSTAARMLALLFESDEARASAAQWRDWAQTATRAVAKKR